METGPSEPSNGRGPVHDLQKSTEFGTIALEIAFTETSNCVIGTGVKGAVEGARFGACIGVFVGGYIGLVNYATMNLGRKITLSLGVAGFIEWIILGALIGVIYKPLAGKCRPAGV